MMNPSTLPKAIPAPSRLVKIVRVVKRMLAVAAALDSAEAITLRDKRRILSSQLDAAHHKGSSQVVDYPLRQSQSHTGPQTKRLAG